MYLSVVLARRPNIFKLSQRDPNQEVGTLNLHFAYVFTTAPHIVFVCFKLAFPIGISN